MAPLLVVLVRFARRVDGEDLLEYGLLAALIAVVAIAGVTSLGNAVKSVLWQPIAQNF